MPTNKEKRNLPFDIRKMYCQSVDIYQQIVYYEMEIITEQNFIDEVRKIVKKYEDAKETFALLP